MSQPKRFLTKPGLGKRWNKTPRTIDRWCENPPPGFPMPMLLNGRKHWDEDEIEAYERSCAAAVRSVKEAA